MRDEYSGYAHLWTEFMSGWKEAQKRLYNDDPTPPWDKLEVKKERGKISNPLFLPKSLFDSYIVKSSDGTITVDRIQTISGAEKKVKELAKRYPCVGFDIKSSKHGSVIKSYDASVGHGAPKVITDNTREFKRQAEQEAKDNVKFGLYVDGKWFADYDSKREAEAQGKRVVRADGGRFVVKQSKGNPKRPAKDKYTVLVTRGSESIGEYTINATAAGIREFKAKIKPEFSYKIMSRDGVIASHVGTKRNPVDSAAEQSAADLYRKFHGADSDGVTRYVDDMYEPDTFAELGDLISLEVKGTHVKKACINAPDPDTNDLHGIVKLASTPDGKQLYFIGGDQSLPLKELGFENSHVRQAMVIGVLAKVTYRTRKGFDKFESIDYYHELGEETGEPPYLLYDPVNKHMYVAGGDYKILPAGITN